MSTDNSPHANRAQQRRASLTRRHFLRGVGACIAVPAFESFLPTRLCAAIAEPAAKLATSASGAPMRMAFVYFPNGANQDAWWPTDEGKEWKLSPTLEPLKNIKHKLQVLGGLDHLNADPGVDGAGDHARANGTFLTGMRVRKAVIQNGVSIDQLAAEHVGHLTRLASLELGCDPARTSGNCDSNYSCAYQYNLAWRSATTPLAPEANPRLVFERLFGAGDKGQRAANYRQRQQQQRSILDFVLDDAKSMKKQLAQRDGQKLDEYLASLRDIEQRIERAEQFGDPPDPNADVPQAGIPKRYEDHMQLMYRMMVLAFQTDSTRIATLLLSHDGSNRSFPDLEISEGHHDLSHHRSKEENLRKIAAIDRWYVQQFAQFLEELDRTKDVDGNSLLDNSMIVYGCGNSDGNSHTHSNLPILFAGGGGATLQPGQYKKLGGVPMSNLFLSMLDRMGVEGTPRFGDSTGRLEGI